MNNNYIHTICFKGLPSAQFQVDGSFRSPFIRISSFLAIILWVGLTDTSGQTDSSKYSKLIELEAISITNTHLKDRLPEVLGTQIFAGKKTDLLTVTDQSNLPQNVGRMIFAKIPGINLWDMDGAGTQLNISTRGTDAHRSIEMNMRQNGYNTNSDMFGYPENHYTVAMQGVKQIQLVRGSAALQFGSQFGGMMNYVMKSGDPDKEVSIESEQTYGSNNLFNSFNAIGGTKGKVSYYAFYDDRQGDGWRPNSAFHYKSWYSNVKYQFNEKGSLAIQYSRMHYEQQIGGGLTDEMFAQNARQSNRTRNFFSPTINIPAAILQYQLSPNTQLDITTNGIWGDRSSVQFINTPNVEDTFNTALGSYNPRQVDRDFYAGYTMEARLLHRYNIGQSSAILSGGIRYFNEHTKRRQKGKGTVGNDLTFDLIGTYGVDLRFHTTNYAIFAENIFHLGKKLSLTPGFRYELIQSELTGVIQDRNVDVNYSGNRSFPLFGLGMEYDVNKNSELYGNISEAYRPYLYSQVTPANQISKIDPNLRDSKGYNIDFGYRATFSDRINLDISVFYQYYGDRIGNINIMNADNSSYLYTTNVGNSAAEGVEAYLEIAVIGSKKKSTELSLFNSLAYTHARYLDGMLNNNGENQNLRGNRVEGVPDWINRAGLDIRYKTLSSRIQLSHIGKKYNDANNTIFDPVGTSGLIPSYSLVDWSMKWKFSSDYHLSGGINNLLDTKYFSRRIPFYPGPGILPGDGRTFYITLGIKL